MAVTKQDIKTAIIIGLSTFTVIGVAYLVLPEKWGVRKFINDKIVDKFKKNTSAK